jgi:hypothetical protein
MRIQSIPTFLFAAGALAVACKSNPDARPASATSSAPVANPSASNDALGAQEGPSIRGRVIETIDVTHYTYVFVETASEKLWAAVPKIPLSVGDTVAIERPMPVRKFHSPSLNRDFELIYFGVLKGQQPMDRSSMSPHGSSIPALPIPKRIQVDKAKAVDAYTVEEIGRDGAKLAGKQATVQAMVVKVNVGILDRNWIHLQDGTGSADGNTNELLVTSHDVPRIGSVVVAKGKVATNRDFGSGYSYKVLLEEAFVVQR